MRRRYFLATTAIAMTAGCVDTVSKRATRSAVDATEPDGDGEGTAGEFRYALEEETPLDVVELTERRVDVLQSNDLWITIRTDHPTEVPNQTAADEIDPEPGEIEFVLTAGGSSSGAESEIEAVTLLYAGYIDHGGEHNNLHVTVIDGFDEELYQYQVKREWVDRYVDGPAKFVEVVERVLETVEVSEAG